MTEASALGASLGMTEASALGASLATPAEDVNINA
jgi:hypothetical protein